MAINKQPVFTTAPILKTKIYDPDIITGANAPGSYFLTNNSLIFTSTDDNGTLVERITVSSTGDTSWSLYKTAAMPATTVSDTTPNAEIEWVFTGGLVLPDNFEIYIGASTNQNATSQRGDNLSVTLEGSTYTAI